MKKEFRVFFTAVMFFTRLPCPKWVDHSPEYLQRCMHYFPLIGIIVGIIGVLIYTLSLLLFPKSIALLLSMIATIAVTGALHEDGLADTCDGFGGGWIKERILSIMKDSRTGTYGVIGLLSVLSLKFAGLYYLPLNVIPLAVIAGHSLSRFSASTLLLTHAYVREDSESKSRVIAGHMSFHTLLISAIFGMAPLLLFLNPVVFLILIPVLAARWYLGREFTKRIGGITGDCLGAAQQISEVVFYLSLVALWKFI